MIQPIWMTDIPMIPDSMSRVEPEGKLYTTGGHYDELQPARNNLENGIQNGGLIISIDDEGGKIDYQSVSQKNHHGDLGIERSGRPGGSGPDSSRPDVPAVSKSLVILWFVIFFLGGLVVKLSVALIQSRHQITKMEGK